MSTDFVVQQYLESQVEELRALSERGIFSSEEIRQMVSQRRSFEYSVKASGTTKNTWYDE